jgi:hypothetical protein
MHINAGGSLPDAGNKRQNRQQKEHIGQNQSDVVVLLDHFIIIFITKVAKNSLDTGDAKV